MRNDGPEERVPPGLRTVYRLSVGIILLGMLYSGFYALIYYGGTPAHISESEEMGTRYVPAQTPGLPQHRIRMLFGVWSAGAGMIVLIGTGLVDVFFRIRKDKVGYRPPAHRRKRRGG